MKLNDVSSPEKRRWTEYELRYLWAHREDGAHLIARALGRTPTGVRVKAARLHVSLGRRPVSVCPECGEYFVRDNKAGRHGMCRVCWERRKAAVMREAAAERRARSEYEAAKKRSQRSGAR